MILQRIQIDSIQIGFAAILFLSCSFEASALPSGPRGGVIKELQLPRGQNLNTNSKPGFAELVLTGDEFEVALYDESKKELDAEVSPSFAKVMLTSSDTTVPEVLLLERQENRGGRFVGRIPGFPKKSISKIDVVIPWGETLTEKRHAHFQFSQND